MGRAAARILDGRMKRDRSRVGSRFRIEISKMAESEENAAVLCVATRRLSRNARHGNMHKIPRSPSRNFREYGAENISVMLAAELTASREFSARVS